MRRLVSEFIDEILERGDVDLAASLAHPLPLSLVSHIMGIPKSDQPVVTDWFFRLVERGEGEASVPGAAHQAAQEYSEYVREAVSSRRRSPRDDLFTRLAAWEGTGEMSAEEVVRMTIGMLIAGIHTTESLIATALLLLQQMAEERTVLATSLPSPGSRGASCWRSSSGVYPATMSSARFNDVHEERPCDPSPRLAVCRSELIIVDIRRPDEQTTEEARFCLGPIASVCTNRPLLTLVVQIGEMVRISVEQVWLLNGNENAFCARTPTEEKGEMTLAPSVFADAHALGRAVADETCAGVQEVARNGRPYLLGCPRGRGPLSTYMALARSVRAQGRAIFRALASSSWTSTSSTTAVDLLSPPLHAHFSVAGFAARDKLGLERGGSPGRGIDRHHFWRPGPGQPSRLRRASGRRRRH